MPGDLIFLLSLVGLWRKVPLSPKWIYDGSGAFVGPLGGGFLKEAFAALRGQWPPANALPLTSTEYYVHGGLKWQKDQQPLETI